MKNLKKSAFSYDFMIPGSRDPVAPIPGFWIQKICPNPGISGSGLTLPEKSHFKDSIHRIVELNISNRGRRANRPPGAIPHRRVSMFK